LKEDLRRKYGMTDEGFDVVEALAPRPTCEHCNRALPSESTEARICSFECTPCAACADALPGNVCSNCGGEFTPRPIRPARNWRNGNLLGAIPARTLVKHRPVDPVVDERFAAELRRLPPERR
jgi:hypothetical protein